MNSETDTHLGSKIKAMTPKVAAAGVTLALIWHIGTLDVPAEVPAFLLFMWLIVTLVPLAARAFDRVTANNSKADTEER